MKAARQKWATWDCLPHVREDSIYFWCRISRFMPCSTAMTSRMLWLSAGRPTLPPTSLPPKSTAMARTRRDTYQRESLKWWARYLPKDCQKLQIPRKDRTEELVPSRKVLNTLIRHCMYGAQRLQGLSRALHAHRGTLNLLLWKR